LYHPRMSPPPPSPNAKNTRDDKSYVSEADLTQGEIIRKMNLVRKDSSLSVI